MEVVTRTFDSQVNWKVEIEMKCANIIDILDDEMNTIGTNIHYTVCTIEVAGECCTRGGQKNLYICV